MTKSKLKFIDIETLTPDFRTVSLSHGGRMHYQHPRYLSLIGGLEHNTQIRPKTANDAKALIDWLKKEFEL